MRLCLIGFRRLLKCISPGLILVISAGCAVSPEPLMPQAVARVTAADRARAEAVVPPLTEPLTLEACVARALKYNLNHRVTLLEEALAVGQLEASRFDMMPSLLANAGYTWRSNDNTRSSTSLAPLPSIERSHRNTDLTFYWSLLDFGLGYYNAKENADRSLIAVEKRRRAMNNLIRDVETAFWRAAAAQRLKERVATVLTDAEGALERSRTIVENKLQPLKEALGYQRNLLENIRLLESVNEELSLAETELAGLIGGSPGAALPLHVPEILQASQLQASIPIVEQLALMHNPDLRIKHYEARIAVLETQRALWELIPDLSFSYSINYDDDQYLVNNRWRSAGLSVGNNLLNLLWAPERQAVAAKGVELAELRRMALQMTMLTQVHLALQQFQHSDRQFRRAQEVFEVDAMLARQTSLFADQEMASDLDRISSQVTAILSEVRLYHALAKVKESEIQIQSTVGVEPKIASLDQISLTDLETYLMAELRSDMLFKRPNPSGIEPQELEARYAKRGPSAPSSPTYWIEMGRYFHRDQAYAQATKLNQRLSLNSSWRWFDTGALVRYELGNYLVQAGPFDREVVGAAQRVAQSNLNQQFTVREYEPLE